MTIVYTCYNLNKIDYKQEAEIINKIVLLKSVLLYNTIMTNNDNGQLTSQFLNDEVQRSNTH